MNSINRIGVVSLYGHYNYGNRLQSKAVCKIIEQHGCEPVIINCLQPLTKRFKKAIKLKLGLQNDPSSLMRDIRSKRFLKFSEYDEVLNISSRELSSKLCDAFVVGSDQIWNPDVLRPRLCFLEFAEKRQRIALAPSFGCNEIPNYMIKTYRNGLLGFDNLSVREHDGVDIIEQISGQKAVHLCDPVFGLNKSDWISISSDDVTPEEDYILVYSLGNTPQDCQLKINRLAKTINARIVKLSDKSRFDEIDPGPSEFISLIRHAKCVVTDSFHCAAFSIIMNTPFFVFRRIEKVDTFSRLMSLLKMFDMEEAQINKSEQALDISRLHKVNNDILVRENDRIHKYIQCELNRALK